MVEYAFKNIESYLEFFKEIEEIYKSKESTLKTILSEIENKYADLLDEKPKKQEEFLIPEIPKIKKDVKDKPESSRASRASRRDPSILSKSSLSQNDSEVIRRSSRIASKTKLKPSIASKISSKSQDELHSTYIVSPSHIPIKIRRTCDEESNKNGYEQCSALEESLCPANMKPPLGSSTPTPSFVTPEKKNKSLNEIENKPKATDENKSPNNTARVVTVKGESVKKKVEDFEKRVKGNLPTVKLSVKDTENNKPIAASKPHSKVSRVKKEMFTEDEANNKESQMVKPNSKILQEIKVPNEKILEAAEKKKAAMKKVIEENKRKREERERKVAAQREAAEKEKQLAAMKLEKEKEEKAKLIQKMKDDKLKEDTLKKKQIALLKATEIEERRKQEEAAKLAKLKKTLLMQKQAAKEVPQYNIDNVLEDDSSEDEDKPKKQVPSWATKKGREYPLSVQAWLNKKETVYRWFYNKNLKYPKLEELFSTEIKTRPRTSSAFWTSRICFNESFPIA